MRKTYAEKLKDPRWQRKRLEIFKRDGFACNKCGDKDETLHIHHRFYTKYKDPWNYPDESLVTLCVYCHEYETDNISEAIDGVLKFLKLHLYSDAIILLNAKLKRTFRGRYDKYDQSNNIADFIENLVFGIAKQKERNEDQIYDRL